MNDSLKYDEYSPLSIDDEFVETHYLLDLSTGRIKFIKDDPCYIVVRNLFKLYCYNINNCKTIKEYDSIWNNIRGHILKGSHIRTNNHTFQNLEAMLIYSSNCEDHEEKK